MGELVKTWNDGAGSLTVAYDGDRDGSSVFSSDINEGIDREIVVSFADKDRTVVVDRTVRQIGLREVFNAADGAFILADGGTFNVLKPIQYTPLEYIESTGAQYIDTGANIDTSTDEIEVVIQGLTKTTYKWFLGEHDNASRFGFGSGDGPNKRNVAYGNSTYKVADSQVYNTKHTFVANENGLFLDGEKIANYASFASTSSIYLFHLNLNNQSSYMGSSRIWSYKHRRNGALLLDLIPALDPEGVACMLDKVSRAFFYSKTDEGFVAGPINHPLPIGCKELTYIESTGTQYIDTEVKLTNNHSVAVDYQLTEARQSRKGIFGVLTSNMTARFGALLSPSNNYLEFGYGAGNVYWQHGLPDTNRHYYEQRQNESYFDGVLVYTFASATFSTGANAPLGNFAFTNYAPAKAKYFGAKIWDGSSLIRNFVPVLDTDGAVCMFDRVSGKFFYNKGTGTFIAGELK